jgi:hypothetical protein
MVLREIGWGGVDFSCSPHNPCRLFTFTGITWRCSGCFSFFNKYYLDFQREMVPED